MQKQFRTALVFVLGAILLSAQNAAPQNPSAEVTSTWKTTGSWNGRFWKHLSPEERIMFLLGYESGVEEVAIPSAGSFERFNELYKLFWAKALTFVEVRAALNAFYETPENGSISIHNAIHLISKRSEGATEADIQEEIADLRKRANQ
jgi:hypothetical protein